MIRLSALRALLLASTALAALAVPRDGAAQSAASPSTQSGTADAIRVLLDQANYWRSQFQDDKANEALSRVLVLDPNNADALAMQAQAAADNGNQAVAKAALAKLKSVRPDDPRIPGVEQALKMAPVDPKALAEARDLARDGKPAEAVAAYRRAFNSDTPPPGLATEYYQTLASTDGDWRIPRAGLAQVLRSNPQDLRAQLAYAELLTYHLETRSEGVDRLSKLALNPAIADRATKDLRQSLTWLPVSPSSVPQYDIYLAKHPDDTTIAKLEQAAKSNSGELRSSGFDALHNDDLPEAEAEFTAALKVNPNDTDAMVGLGLVRLQQQRRKEGIALLQQAIALDPSKADQYQPLIDGAGGRTQFAGNQGNGNEGNRNQGYDRFDRARYARYYARLYGRRIRAQYARIGNLVSRGEFAQAEALLRRVSGRRMTLGNLTYLADIEARAGRLDEAESDYRAVLAKSPRNVQALGGLAGVLERQGKQDEADTLYAQVASLPGGAPFGEAHANALRLQAQQLTDPLARIGMYRAAVAAAPEDPWIRLELARALLAQHDDGAARQVMASVGTGPHPKTDQIEAAIYFANEVHDDQVIPSLVDRLPRKDQTPTFLAMRNNAQYRQDIQEARALGSPDAERDRLLSLANQPDPSGLRVAAYGNELIKMGDRRAAREAVRLALANRPVTAEQRVTYAGVLLGAGYPADARQITQSVSPADPQTAHALAEVEDGAAVMASDRLNAAGRPDAAYDQLAPRLAAQPDNPDLNLALARLYTSNKQPDKAVAITQNLLKQDPANLNVRSTAVYARLAAGDIGQAREIARASTEQFPNEPQAWYDLANVERARGNPGGALRDLETAKALRQKQLAGQPDTSGGTAEQQDAKAPGSASIEPLHRRYAQYAAYIPPNVASDVPSMSASDVSPDLPEPVTRQYAAYDPNALLPIETPSASPAATAGYAPFDPAATAPPQPAALAPTQQTAAPATAAPPGNVQVSQNVQTTQALDAPAAGNPFHPGSTPLPSVDEPATPGVGDYSRTTGGIPTDSLTAQIDEGIDQLKREVAPRLDASVYVRGRTGADGFERLIEFGAPVEASYSPNGYGRLKVVVTPTYLYSGKSNDSYDLGRFGTNPLAGGTGPGAVPIRNQTAFGTALDVGYAYDIVTADIGSSPLGFLVNNVVGGIELSPKLTNDMTLRLTAERRVVTDSILSYGGDKDVRSGEVWGGVTRNRGHIQVDGTAGLFTYFAGAGGGYLVGDKVASNTEIDAVAGLTYPVWRTPTQEVRIGTTAVYFSYDKNLGGFSLGQGGYFSPQQYAALLFPVTYRDQYSPDLRFSIGGSVGYQNFHERSSPVFPNNASLQAQLVALAPTTGAATTIAGANGSGIAGGVNGEIDYRVNPNLHIGARAGFDHSGIFSEGTGLLYARYVFDDTL
jgi:predicted Zn-dependent protease